MNETGANITFLVLGVGGLLALAILLKAVLERLKIPALIGYIVLGLGLRVLQMKFGLYSQEGMEFFEFLAKIGIIVLLFRIGLESNLKGLLHQLRRASGLWFVNVVASTGLGYAASYFLVGLSVIPSLFIATALTATSVGIPVGVWHDSEALDSPNGELLVDVAELDDISSVVFMALLFAIAPALKESAGDSSVLSIIVSSGGRILLKLFAFGGFCVVFSLYIEKHITRFIQNIQMPPEPMLLVVSLGIILGAVAGLLGFSVAIGAFFAGLVFSRDPEAIHSEASFSSLYELFSPFFFIGIGLNLDPDALGTAGKLGALLLLVAVVSKLVGVGGPALLTTKRTGAILLGVSMIPRAEIAMIVMQRGLQEGDWAVTSQVYAAMVLVSAITCVATPILIHLLLQKWPQKSEKTGGEK